MVQQIAMFIAILSLSACPGIGPDDVTATLGEESGITTGESSGETSDVPVTTGSGALCGNAALEPEEECDRGAQNGPGRECSALCTLNVCGDADVLIGVEDCDDGDLQDDDGCDAACRLTGPCLNSLLANPGFEEGTLSPWKTNGDVEVTAENPHSEQWSAVITGNYYIEQTLAATPTGDISSARFWSWHDAEDQPLLLIEWSYADETSEQRIFEMLDGWNEHDILGDLDAGKDLVTIRIWGYMSTARGPNISVLDDFKFCAR